MATLRRASSASYKGPRGKLRDEEEPSKKNKEFVEQGKVKWDVYMEYAKTSNLVAVAFYLLTLLGGQTAQIGGSVWLKNWAETNEEQAGNPNVGKYIGIYFAFGIGSAALVVIQTLILWIFCSIEVRSPPPLQCMQVGHQPRSRTRPRHSNCLVIFHRPGKLFDPCLLMPALHVGLKKATRTNGFRHLPLANELFRDYTCRENPEPLFKVR